MGENVLNEFFNEGEHNVITAFVRAQIYKHTEFFRSTGGHAHFPVKTHPNLKKQSQSPPASNPMQKEDF